MPNPRVFLLPLLALATFISPQIAEACGAPG